VVNGPGAARPTEYLLCAGELFLGNHRLICTLVHLTAPARLSDEDVAKVLAMPEPWGFVARFALGTGLRWGELVMAEISHIREGVLIVRASKTGKVRRIPLSPALASEVRSRIGRVVPLDRALTPSQVYNRSV
jgi:integrase